MMAEREARRRAGGRAPVVFLLVAVALPVAAAFGFGAAPAGGLGRLNGLRSSCTARQRPALRAAIRMDRKDGGAGKVSKPGGGGGLGGKPGQGAGSGGAGEMEGDGRGAGVAVLTKPPDVDKVGPRCAQRARWMGGGEFAHVAAGARQLDARLVMFATARRRAADTHTARCGTASRTRVCGPVTRRWCGRRPMSLTGRRLWTRSRSGACSCTTMTCTRSTT
jgi:hypothetical protein